MRPLQSISGVSITFPFSRFTFITEPMHGYTCRPTLCKFRRHKLPVSALLYWYFKCSHQTLKARKFITESSIANNFFSAPPHFGQFCFTIDFYTQSYGLLASVFCVRVFFECSRCFPYALLKATRAMNTLIVAHTRQDNLFRIKGNIIVRSKIALFFFFSNSTSGFPLDYLQVWGH